MTGKRTHEYVPVHELMSDKEVNSLSEEKGIEKENLPKIFVDDPQAKMLGAKSGQVIKIEREDCGNRYLYYRLVIEG